MDLRSYLAATGETNASFAKRVGVNERTIDRILAGQGCQLRVAKSIVRASQLHPTPLGEFVTYEELPPQEVAA